jgi:hypothetical protein
MSVLQPFIAQGRFENLKTLLGLQTELLIVEALKKMYFIL